MTNEKSHGTVCLKALTNQWWMVSFSCETIHQAPDGSTVSFTETSENVGTTNMAHHYWKFNLVPSKWSAQFYLRPRDTSVIWGRWVKTDLMTNLMRRIYRNLFCGPSGHKCSCVSMVTVHFRAICRSVEKLERILMLWIGHYLSKEESINLTAGKHAWNRCVYVPSAAWSCLRAAIRLGSI